MVAVPIRQFHGHFNWQNFLPSSFVIIFGEVSIPFPLWTVSLLNSVKFIGRYNNQREKWRELSNFRGPPNSLQNEAHSAALSVPKRRIKCFSMRISPLAFSEQYGKIVGTLVISLSPCRWSEDLPYGLLSNKGYKMLHFCSRARLLVSLLPFN